MKIKKFPWLYFTYLLVFFLAGVYLAISKFWVCDDAFISFRYARNLSRGMGLVFNSGEYVEGFTNMLWTLIMTPAIGLGFDPVIFSGVLGTGFYAGILIGFFYYFMENENFDKKSIRFSMLIVVFPALAIHHHMQVFASSGLETSLFVFLVFVGVVRILNHIQIESESLDHRYSFLVLSLATLTRPDGLIFYFICAFFLLILNFKNDNSGKRKLYQVLKCAFKDHHLGASLILLSILFRYYYYGDFFPNTFYAKSAYDSYFSQGLIYLYLFFSSYWILGILSILMILLLAGPPIFFRSFRARIQPQMILLFVLIFFWSGYVAWVGGDFMFARFLLPVTPLLFYFLRYVPEILGFPKTIVPGPLLVFLISIVFLLAVFFRYDHYKTLIVAQKYGITEEYRIYPLDSIRKLGGVARQLSPFIKRSGTNIAFSGGQAFLVYYMDPHLAIESSTGLTDHYIAHQNIYKRGQPGHEKRAPLAYLQKRQVNIWFEPPSEKVPKTDIFSIHGLPGRFQVVVRDREKFKILNSSGFFSELN